MRWLAPIVLAVACGHGKAGGSAASTADRPTLYDRIGGRDAIMGLVKDFVEERVQKDTRISAYFTKVDIPGLEHKLVDQLCVATGGPCTYTGKDMRTAHAGIGVDTKAFDALVDDFGISLEHFKVGAREQQELLATLGAMRSEIVAK
jgi:hemoglobin